MVFPSVTQLGPTHQRKNFSCGIEQLDRYLKEQANQDVKRSIATTYILPNKQSSTIIGYYTLSSTAIESNDLPEVTTQKLPRYRLLPATLIGRLAVDSHFHGKGYGEFLLMDALKRSYLASQTIASFAVLVEAINPQAKLFYIKYGMTPLRANTQQLYSTMATIKKSCSQYSLATS